MSGVLILWSTFRETVTERRERCDPVMLYMIPSQLVVSIGMMQKEAVKMKVSFHYNSLSLMY